MVKTRIRTQEEVKVGDKLYIHWDQSNHNTNNEPLVCVYTEEQKNEGDFDDVEEIGFLCLEKMLNEDETPSKEVVDNFNEVTSPEGLSTEVINVEEIKDLGIYEVTLQLKKVETDTAKNLQNILAGQKTWTFEVKGSVSQNRAKADAIEKFRKGQPVELELLLDHSNNIALVDPANEVAHDGTNITAGEIIDMTGEEKAEIVNYMSKKSTRVKGRISDVAPKSYTAIFGVDAEEWESFTTGKTVETVRQVMEEAQQRVPRLAMAELEDIQIYLDSQAVPKVIQKQLFNKIKDYPEEYQKYIPSKPKNPFRDGNKGLLIRAIAYMLTGNPVLLRGIAGTGKDKMIETLNWVIQKPLFVINFHAQTDDSAILGEKTLVETENDNVVVEHQLGLLPVAMEIGGSIHFVEMNAAHPSVTMVLHTAIETDQKFVDIPGYGRVDADDEFIPWGSMNPGYHGTGEVNQALKSRFIILDFGENESILHLLESDPETNQTDDKILKQIDRVYRDLREEVKQDRQSEDAVVFRGYKEAAIHARNPYVGLEMALIDCVANKINDPEQQQWAIDTIKKQVSS